MFYKKTYLLIVIGLLCFFHAKTQTTVTGIVVDALENKGIAGVEVIIIGSGIKTETDSEGKFNIISDKAGIISISFSVAGYDSYFGSANAKISQFVDMGTVKMTPIAKADNESSVLVNEEFQSDDEGQRISSLLTASNDLFERTATFNFNVARFKIRGLGSEYGTMYLNGMPVEDLEDGYISWSTWGGLNDVMRVNNNSSSLEPPFFDFGALTGSNYIDLLASSQWKQTRISFAESNRTYRHRAMVTHSSGMMDNGWAYSLSASRRWAEEGYIEGTFYDSYSAFISVDKKINDKHLLNFISLVAPNQRGTSSGSVQEMYDLAGSNYYNSNWGYQEGEKRNSRINSSFQPLGVLRHVWKYNKNSELSTSVGALKGSYGKTRLDWYYAPDPRPDYYGYLPSYQESQDFKDMLSKSISENETLRQVNWNEIYLFNKTSSGEILKELNYSGDISNEKLSHYVLQEQREDPTKLTFNTNLQTVFSDKIGFNGGLSYVYQKTKYFQIVKDLLGGTFFLNWDKYAERDFPDDLDKTQYDINNPNRIVREGDDYGYNYFINTSEAQAWAKTSFTFNRFDAFAAAELSNTSFFREGNYKNGKFPDNSYGKSETFSFFNYGVKAGVTFKINGRNYVYLNGLTMTKAPYARNAYISPRTRDQVVDNLKSEKINSGEMAYVHKSPYFSFKASAYYIDIRDKIKVSSFFHDEEQSFVNYIMTGINQVHYGTELSAEYKINASLSVSGVAAIGQYLYNNRPIASISQDNTAEVLTDRIVYIKNYRIPGTPQQAFSAGIRYNSPKYWFATLSFNYFADMWLDFFPDRRTEQALDGLDKESDPDLWYSIISQEKLPSDFTVDFFGGKSWKIKNKFLYLNVGINNILNNQDFITGGFEQFRFDYQGKNVNKFPSKYYYAYGANYYISLSLRI